MKGEWVVIIIMLKWIFIIVLLEFDRHFEKFATLDHGGPEMICSYLHRNCWKKVAKIIGRMPWLPQ